MLSHVKIKEASQLSQKTAHEGVKYLCGQCVHEATSKGFLNQHIRAVHEGVRGILLDTKEQFMKG